MDATKIPKIAIGTGTDVQESAEDKAAKLAFVKQWPRKHFSLGPTAAI